MSRSEGRKTIRASRAICHGKRRLGSGLGDRHLGGVDQRHKGEAMTSEDWKKKVLKARKRFELGVMGRPPRVKFTIEDIDRLRRHLINLASRRFTCNG